MRFCTLKEFIAEEGYNIDSHDRIYKYNGIERDRLTKTHINITNISFEAYDSTGVILDVDFASPDEKIHASIEVHRAYSGHRNIYNWDELQKILVPTIQKRNLITIQKIYKRYFIHCINDFLRWNPTALADCGWSWEYDTRYFISLNRSLYSVPKAIEKDFFNGRKTAQIFKEKLHLLSFQNFFDFICMNECALTAFSYSIHAILWNYLHGYQKPDFSDSALNPDTIFFSLCLYGNNPCVSKIIANLLSNLFIIKRNAWNVISHKYHISATSLSDRSFNNLKKYKSVPIIVTSKEDRLTRASSILKKIQRQRNDSCLHMSPVYICKTPIQADEIINCCTDSLIEYSRFNDTDWLDKIHMDFCVLIYNFIQYLTEISKQNNDREKAELQSLNRALYNVFENNSLSDDWLDSHTPETLLYTTMQCFCHFLASTPLSNYEITLLKACRLCFLPHSIPRPVQKPIIQNTFPQDFYQFITESTSKKHSWLFEGCEQRGNKEECYYLDNKEAYSNFIAFLKKSKRPPITKRNFVKMMKDNHLLKLPESGTSNTMKRNGKYVYVIPKNLFQ